jgi:sialate O-acetylesterase
MAKGTLMIRKLASVLVVCVAATAPLNAAVKPNNLFTDNMVLQQNMPVPVWGTAENGEKVTVAFQGQEVSATAQDGKWMVKLDKLKAGGPFTMTIRGGNTVELKNVLVGEVWICSGQSNMEMHLNSCADAKMHVAESKNPQIRLFTVAKKVAAEPVSEVQGKWVECGPDTVGSFSGVAYFFGRDLQKALNVPVGLIHTSWGGTPAEAWTSKPTLEANASLKSYVERNESAIANFAKTQEKYKADLELYKVAAQKAKDEGTTPPKAPTAPANPATSPHRPAGLFNGMIAPVQPYAIKGAIWYQGESNAGQAYLYRTLFPAMITDWRATWKQGDFPFFFVQLAPWQKIVTEPQESAWAELREAQLFTSQTVPHSGMAVITDVGDPADIHPKKKEPVGARLALAARAMAYGDDKLVYSGPVYDKIQVQGQKALLSFKHVGGGLVAKDGKLTGFTIAGDDHKFVNADAEIVGDHVVVSSPNVAKPVAVRYGWANCPVVNLFNKEGIPATPFRTDDWPGVTQPKK